MKQKGTYAVCFLALLCLILSAFYAPGLVMRWNDYQLLLDYQFETREGLDYEAVNLSYIGNPEERLNAFAKGVAEGRQYFVAATGEEPKEWRDVLIEAFSQNLSYALMDRKLLWAAEDIYDRDNISVWDHYLIYDSEGVAFLCWYVEIKTQEQTLRLLMDAVDETVYYAECYQEHVSDVLTMQYNKKYDRTWLLFELMDLKNFYGGDDMVEEEILIEQNKGLCEMKWKEGTLHFGVCYLDQTDGAYGVGIGIEELKALLPSERTGVEFKGVESKENGAGVS